MSDPTILTEDTHSSSSSSDSIGSDIDTTAKQPGMHRADTILIFAFPKSKVIFDIMSGIDANTKNEYAWSFWLTFYVVLFVSLGSMINHYISFMTVGSNVLEETVTGYTGDISSYGNRDSLDTRAWWSWIDDDKLNRVVMTSFLVCSGITAATYGSGQEGKCYVAFLIMVLATVFIVLSVAAKTYHETTVNRARPMKLI